MYMIICTINIYIYSIRIYHPKTNVRDKIGKAPTDDFTLLAVGTILKGLWEADLGPHPKIRKMYLRSFVMFSSSHQFPLLTISLLPRHLLTHALHTNNAGHFSQDIQESRLREWPEKKNAMY